MKTTRMSALEALFYVEEFNVFGPGYTRRELQALWRIATEPLNEIQALGFGKAEAMQLWNARPRNKAEWQALQNDVRALGIFQELTP